MNSGVRLGCGLAGIRSLPRASVGMIFADLPSGQTQAEFDKPINLLEFWDSAWHALHPKGNVVLMASSLGFAAQVIASNRPFFRYDLIWSKSAATGFLNAKKRPLRAHEFILIFSKEAGATYNRQMMEGGSPIHFARRKQHSENYGAITAPSLSRAGATDRHPVSVLEFASLGTSSKQRRHPQQKPVPLLRWLIRTYSNHGDTVVDPCAGSGSFLEAGSVEGRKPVGWDINLRFGSPDATPLSIYSS